MINMLIGLTLVKLIESLVYSNGTEGDPIKLMVKRISWNVLYLWILLMVTSRVFILAHFPHQCILAVILGFLCFKLIFNDQTWIYPIWNRTLEKIFMALFLLLSAIPKRLRTTSILTQFSIFYAYLSDHFHTNLLFKFNFRKYY